MTAEQPISWDPVYGQWNQLMFPEIADCADFLSVLYYFGPRDSPSNHAQRIISDVDKIDEIASHVRDRWKSITGREPIPMAMTEYNMWAEYDCNPATTYYFTVGQLNSVVFALAFGKLIENKYALATAWDLKNGWSGGRDHGLLASREPGVEDNTPHGPFFAYYYFTRVFGDVMVSSDVDGLVIERSVQTVDPLNCRVHIHRQTKPAPQSPSHLFDRCIVKDASSLRPGQVPRGVHLAANDAFFVARHLCQLMAF